MYYKLVDTVYLFNDSNNTVSEYTLQNNGFFYSVFCYETIKYTDYKRIIKFNVNTTELTEDEFIEYANKLADLEQSANSLTPLQTFENSVQSIRDKYNIYMKKHN